MIREFTDRDPPRMTQAELHGYYGIPTGPEPERCECCFQPTETLVATLDGLLCVECVRLAAEPPEPDLIGFLCLRGLDEFSQAVGA